MYLVKHLVKAGSEVSVGSPIMITVENKDDIDKFASYTLPTTVNTPKPIESTPVQPSTQPPAPPKPTPTPVQTKVSTPPPSPPSPPKEVNNVQTKASPPPPSAVVVSQSPWGSHFKKSPLFAKLSQQQKEYATKYGPSLHE